MLLSGERVVLGKPGQHSPGVPAHVGPVIGTPWTRGHKVGGVLCEMKIGDLQSGLLLDDSEVLLTRF